MKKLYTLLFSLCVITLINAQERYLDEVFTDVTVTEDVEYGVNATVLTLPQFGEAVPESLKLDIYEPTDDTAEARPLVLVFHNGNFLPIVTNGQISGTKKDNSVVDVCNALAKRGFVAASVDYRLGWNPFAESQPLRALGIIQAAYRGVQDGRNSVRYFRKTASEDDNPYRIDTDRICAWGVGTGGYITLAMASLDDYAEIVNTTNGPAKFVLDTDGDGVPETPMVVPTFHGDINGVVETVTPIEGFGLPAGDTTNYANYPTYSSDINLTVNIAGALGDLGWLDENTAPIITVQSVNDMFAPYGDAVLSVPGQNLAVVQVQGGNVVHERLTELGINEIYSGFSFDKAGAEAFSAEAEANAATASHDPYVSLYPWIAPANSLGLDEGVVLNWWDPDGPSPINSAGMGAPWNLIPHPSGGTFHDQGLVLNENMSAEKSRANLAKVLGFVMPRASVAMDLPSKELFANNPPSNTITDIVVNSAVHETLEAAVIAAGLAETLASEGPFTLFAPTDAAFAALPEGTVETLLEDPGGALTEILLYHAVSGTALSTDLMDGMMIETINGSDVTVTINNDGVFINDAQVTLADISADNGVVHVIDAVLLPPAPPTGDRYLDEIFTDVIVTSDVEYGVNATVLTLPQFGEAVPESLKLDIYEPMGDTETNRPLMLVFHSGNFLPIVTNGQISGYKGDNSVVDICTSLAKRGYVAASVDYRLGWNPFAESQPLRALGIIQAAYRGVQDGRNSVRYFRKTAAEDGNPYGIDPNKVTAFGVGTGGYITLAMATLNDYLEIVNTTNGPAKFVLDTDGDGVPETPMIVELFHGDINGVVETVTPIEGFGFPMGDTTNYANHVDYSSDINLAINVGGAMGDISWLDENSAPIITVHSINDMFAPYGDEVLSVPGQNLAVVQVQGGSVVHTKSEELGLNEVYKCYDFTLKGGATADATNSSISGSEEAGHPYYPGLYAWSRPANSLGLDEGVVLNWWNPDGPSPVFSAGMGAPWNLIPHPSGGTFHEQGLVTNENMSAEKSRTNSSDVLSFVIPRASVHLDLASISDQFYIAGCIDNVEDIDLVNSLVSAFPNPAAHTISLDADNMAMGIIAIYNTQGALVKVVDAKQASQFNLDITDLASGFHLVQIRLEDGVVTKKVMVQK